MEKVIFRGKRVDNDEWVYGFYFERVRGKDVAANVDKRCFILYETWDEGFIVTEVKPETVGQFTNLKDKDGKMIFEGDIVKTKWTIDNNSIYEVCFSEARCGWFPFACGDGCGCCEHEVEDPEYVEMIGNIYDNKELLND